MGYLQEFVRLNRNPGILESSSSSWSCSSSIQWMGRLPHLEKARFSRNNFVPLVEKLRAKYQEARGRRRRRARERVRNFGVRVKSKEKDPGDMPAPRSPNLSILE